MKINFKIKLTCWAGAPGPVGEPGEDVDSGEPGWKNDHTNQKCQ